MPGPLKFLATLVVVLALQGPVAAGAEEYQDLQDLGLLETDGTLVGTARSPRPTSQIAENVTVISTAQIAELNAHTLADVLQTIPGIQLDQVQTPGSFTFFTMQGYSNTHIQVLIDGVPQNNLQQSQAPLGMIPVQQIERVEIIKGAASAAWGQALGGVVNVITKSPDSDGSQGGALSASYGEEATSNLRGEFSGGKGRLGYYLSGGNLHSEGLLPNNGVNTNNVYGKFSYELPARGNLTLGLSLVDASLGLNETEVYYDTARLNQHYSFLKLSYPLGRQFELEVALRESARKDWVRLARFNPDGSLRVKHMYVLRESTLGGSAQLSWSRGAHRIVSGMEYDHCETRQEDQLYEGAPPLSDRRADRIGVYANGAFQFGDFTFSPGARFDHTGLNGDVFSYTLGATYLLTERTVVRGYGARGYSLPNAVAGQELQRVWTAQLGAETGELPFLWLKGTLFYNVLTDIEKTAFTVLKKQIRQGGELEARTVPLYGVFLTGGYTYTDAREQETDSRVADVPGHLAKFALHYDNKGWGLSGVLSGNYLLRYQGQARNPYDRGVLWDLTLTQKLGGDENSPELFFSGHNLFDGTQYLYFLYPNTGRWLEGGVRCRF